MERFCVYHPRKALLTLFALLLVLAGAFAWLRMSLWMVLVLELTLFLIGWCYIITRPSMWVNRAVKIWREQCDPYPMAQVCEELCEIIRNPGIKQIILIDLGVAYAEMGAYEKALDILKTVGEQGVQKQVPVNRIVYYNNLAYFYINLNRLEEAEAALQEVTTLLGTLKNQKQVEHLEQVTRSTRAALALAHKDYAAAVALASGMSEENALAIVNKAFLRAKIHLALEEREAAYLALHYVVANANRLHCRVEAEELLATLNG